MRRKYLALAYIAVFETILSWDKWDGAIEMIMVTLMFWGINVILMIMAEMEEKTLRIIKAIRNAKRLEKENTELRKAIEEALQDLQDTECPLGVRALSASIQLERALENEGREPKCRRD